MSPITPARLAVAAALACSAAFAAQAKPLYHIEPAVPIAGNDWLKAISANGIAAGEATLPVTPSGESDAVTFSNGAYHAVNADRVAYAASSAVGVNSAGTTIGMAWAGTAGTAYGKWDAAGNFTVLQYAGDVEGINDAEQVVGMYVGLATLWEADGTLKTLGTLGGASSRGWALNAKGWATGGATLAGNTVTHPFLYKNGKMTDLGSLGNGGSGYAINAKGHVAGVAYFGPTWASGHPVWWDGTSWHDLVGLGGKGASALGINVHDVVVGSSAIKNKTSSEAFVYIKGEMYQLDKCLDATSASGWQLAEADAINDDGVIVGVGYFNGSQHAFVATPVSP